MKGLLIGLIHLYENRDFQDLSLFLHSKGMNYDTGRRELSRHWHERAIRSVTRRCRAFSIFQNVKYNNKNYTEVLFTNVHIFSPNDIFFAK